MKKIWLVLVLSILIFSNFTESQAIPAFARKYNMTCQTCHSPFPKLKSYGDEFAGNGFVISDKDAPRYYIPTGDEELSLLREVPLAFRLEGFITYNNKNSEQSDFSAPYNFKLLSGGAIANNIAYYFYFFISERGQVAGIEDAFIMFNNLFGTQLDFYIGQYQVSDPLFKRELRITLEDYQIYKTNVGYSKADLTYDRGIMLTYGFTSGTDLVVEILNGNGIGPANNLRNFDDDKYKNLAGRISQEINSNFRLGVFGYYGKEKLTDDFSNSFINEVSMLGPDLTLSLDSKVELNFQYLFRKDKKPTRLNKDIKTKGLFGELIFTPDGAESKWYLTALYNWVDSDFELLNYSAATLSAGYLLKRNIRLIGELTYNLKKEFGQLSVGIISAF